MKLNELSIETELIATLSKSLASADEMHTTIMLVKHKKGNHIIIKQWFTDEDGNSHDFIGSNIIAIEPDQFDLVMMSLETAIDKL